MPEYSTDFPSTVMALPKRSSLSPSQHQNIASRNLKTRVITCLNKLSDRDTHAIATSELQLIARDLTHESFSPFLNCIYGTDSSEKSPVRKQCVSLLGFLSETHGDSLSPFLSKMLANIVRRLKDPDSVVRLACVDSVATMASQITKPSFSVFLKPLMEAISLEQDYNSQIGSALCLASAIEASPDPEPAQLQRLIPRLFKLLKSEAFKAKPALLSLIGSIVAVRGASNHNVLGNLIPCLIEFLGSEDWAARKAAAEALARLAVTERDQLSDFKSSCLKSFENRRFDKVKVVRDSMNQLLEVWKVVPNFSEEISPPSQPSSSSRDNADGHYPSGFETPLSRKKAVPKSRSPPPESSSVTTTRRMSTPNNGDKKSGPAIFCKLDHKKPSDWKFEISIPRDPSFTVASQNDLKERDEKVSGSGENESSRDMRPDTKRVLFSKNFEEKTHKFGGLRSGSRVVPFYEESSVSNVVVSNPNEDIDGNYKDSEDLSLIRSQLLQIENQQSSLLDLLQRFMGSSQNGMRSLETRVHGLEMALDDISYDLAVSTGRISNTDSSCCKLPGTEFLSSKFWRKTEGRYSSSRFSTSENTPSLASLYNVAEKNGNGEPFNPENQRFRYRGGGGLVINPLAKIQNDSKGCSDIFSNEKLKNRVHDVEERQAHTNSMHHVATPVTGIRSSEYL